MPPTLSIIPAQRPVAAQRVQRHPSLEFSREPTSFAALRPASPGTADIRPAGGGYRPQRSAVIPRDCAGRAAGLWAAVFLEAGQDRAGAGPDLGAAVPP